VDFVPGRWYTVDGVKCYKAKASGILVDVERSLRDFRDKNIVYGIAVVRQDDGAFVERHYTHKNGVTTWDGIDEYLGVLEFREVEVEKKIINLDW